jgi:hypothetical protein
MPQVYTAIDGGYFTICDSDLALVFTGEPTANNNALVGIAFRCGSRWRALRHGQADIGILNNRAAAVDRLILDHQRPAVAIDDATKAALPL